MPSSLEGLMAVSQCTPNEICGQVAKTFAVRPMEVGLFRLEQGVLSFVHPEELRTAGRIPVSSSGVVARTARTRKAEVFNDFAEVSHHMVFELIVLEGSAGIPDQVIQKLMSAPVIAEDGTVIGVIQVSRKAAMRSKAGPDFTREDLDKLVAIAEKVAVLIPKLVVARDAAPRKLSFAQTEG